MIRVLILGHWGSHIARNLNTYIGDIRATYVPQGSYLRLLAAPPRRERVVLMRAGFRVGASTPRGRLFDAYWSLLRRTLPNAAPCHYWIGSDVMAALESAEAGTLRWSALLSTRDELHLADAPWLSAELETVGIRATTAHIAPAVRAPQVVPALPKEFSVLTYISAGRFDFYGGEAIMDVARRLPDVRFDVVGSRRESTWPLLANVHWHGWVTDMAQRYAETTVVVRIPRHDGLGNTVVEGLLNARHVVYTYEVPFVRRVWPVTADSLEAALVGFRDAHRAGQLSPNLAGRDYALEEFDEAKLVNDLAALLRART
jgi:Glycosyl transferases group 1